MRKAALFAALRTRLDESLAAARASHQAAMEGAIHDDARPENDKDTRGLEQSYLARGIAQRVAELEGAVAAITALVPQRLARVAVGALVTVEDDGRERVFLVAQHGGGIELPDEVTVLTPSSPIGRAVLGRRVDDDCEVTVGGARRTLVITAIE